MIWVRLVVKRLSRLLQRREIVGRQRFQAQRARQTVSFQSLLPACRLVTQVRAPTGAFACWVNHNTPIGIAHKAYQSSLGICLTTRDARALWHMFWARSFSLLFHNNRPWMMGSGLHSRGAHHPCATLVILHRRACRRLHQRRPPTHRREPPTHRWSSCHRRRCLRLARPVRR